MAAHRTTWPLARSCAGARVVAGCALAVLWGACSAELGGSGEALDGGESQLDGGAHETAPGEPGTDAALVQLDASGSAAPDAELLSDSGPLPALDGSQEPALDAAVVDAGADAAGNVPPDAQADSAATDASLCSRGAVDLVWAVDGSASMLGEITDIGAQLSRLLTQLAAAGADVRMTVLSPFNPVALAGGEPSDRYRFIMVDIQNQNALDALLSSFSSYAPFLRAGVRTDVAVASDSDSTLTSSSFRSQLDTLLGHPFTFHALAEPSSFFGSCATAEKPGVHYEELTSQTGGLFHSICTTSWATTFDAIGSGILLDAPIVCQ